jgi:hypothetical protein
MNAYLENLTVHDESPREFKAIQTDLKTRTTTALSGWSSDTIREVIAILHMSSVAQANTSAPWRRRGYPRYHNPNPNWSGLLSAMGATSPPNIQPPAAPQPQPQGVMEKFMMNMFNSQQPPPVTQAVTAPRVCEICGRAGHARETCWQLHPELRPSYPQRP